jgi:hypothetical protein
MGRRIKTEEMKLLRSVAGYLLYDEETKEELRELIDTI